MALFKEWISKSRGGKEVPLKLEWYMQNLLDGNPCAQHYILDKAKSLNITLLLNVSMRSLQLYVNSGREDDIQKLQSMLPKWIVKKRIPFEDQWESRESIVEAVQTHLRRNQKIHHNKVFVMSESTGFILVGTDDVIEIALKLVERYIESLKETMGVCRAVTGSTLESIRKLENPSGDEKDKIPSTEDPSTGLNLLDWSDCIVGSDVIAVAFLNQNLSTDLESFLKKESHYEEWKKISSQLLTKQHEKMNANTVQPTVGFSTSGNKNRQFVFILIPGGETEVDKNTRKSCISTLLQGCVSLKAASVGLVVDVPDDAVKTVGKQIVHTCLDDSHLQITIFCLREQKDILSQLVKNAVYQLGTINRMRNPNKTNKELKDKASNKHKLQICLQVDELSRVEADVLVNSVNPDLNISLGGVSKSLNDATRGKLQIALQKAYPNGIREGTFAITDSCGLRSKEVFHGTLKLFSKKILGIINNSKSKSKDFELMKDFIHRCLHEVRSHKYKSVAFPVLGCGNLGYPPEDVVHVMFDSVEQFFKEYGQSYVCKVIFVLYPTDKEIIKIFHEEWMARNFGINLKANPETSFSCGKIILQIFSKDIWNDRGESDGLLCFWNEDLYRNPSKHPVVGADLQGIKWDTHASDLEQKRFTKTVGGNLPAKFLYHIRTDGPDVERPLLEALSKASISGCFTLLVPIVDEVSNLSWLDFSKTFWKVLLLTEGNLTVVTLLVKKTGIYKALLDIMQQLKDGTMQSSYSDILSSAETCNMSSTCQSSKEPSVMAVGSDTTGKRDFDKLKSEMASKVAPEDQFPEGENLFYDVSSNQKSYLLHQAKALYPPSTKTGLPDDWKTEKISSLVYAAAKYLVGQQEMETTCRIQGESDGHVIVIFFDTPAAKKVHAQIIGFNCTDVDIPTTKDVPHFLEIVMNDLNNVYTELDQEKKQVHIVSTEWIDLDTAKKRIQNKFSTKTRSRQNRRFTLSSNKTLSLDSSADKSFSQRSEISNPLDNSLANISLSESLNQSNPLDSSRKRSLSEISDQTNCITFSSANRRLSQRSDQSPPFESLANRSSSGRSEQSEPPDSPPSATPQNNTALNLPGPGLEKGTAVFKIEFLVVKVYIADITKLKIDVIINAANGQLSHESGVARAIADAAGDALEKEGNTYVYKHGPIPVSEVVSTTNGNMKCKMVLHAVGPRWSDYTDKKRCLEDLCKTFLRCLIETSNRGLTSVAIPASSSATYRIPKKMCAAIYVRALNSFNKVIKLTSLKEVHFVDISDDLLVWIREELNAHLCEASDSTELAKDSAFIQHCLSSKPEHSVGRAPVVKYSSRSLQPVVKPPRHSVHSEKQSAGAGPLSGPGESVETKFQFNENLSVTVINANIFKVEANALVSWEGRGSKASSLFQKSVISEGGKIYEEERQKRLQQAGKRNIIPTKSGNLIQGQVIHVLVGMSVNLEDFVSLVTKLFKRCVSWNYTSVLLPVFLNFSSTVKDKKPVSLFMETVVDVLAKLSEEKTRPMLRVIIVDQEERVVQDLSSALSKYLVSLGLAQNTDKSIRGDNDCPICFDKMTDPERLSCGHSFCKECLKQAFDTKKACPICGRLYGPIIGTTPKGEMRTRKESSSLPGFPGCGTIVITYNIPDGTQTEEHPHPGKHFVGAFWRAYLPDSYEGRKVLRLLRVAWRRRLTFTVGRSVSLDWDVDRVTWNEILHKTSRTGGNFGYPDETYLQRVHDELEQKGITEKDLQTPIH